MAANQIFDIAGKHAIVTGGTRGIGRAIAEAYCANGAKVVFIGSNAEKLKQTVAENVAKGYDAYAVVADLSKLEEVDRAFDESLALLDGKLDILCPAAGIQHRDAPEDFPIEKFIEVQKVNVLHCYRMAQRAIQVMLKQEGRGRGKIVLIGSLGCFTVGHNISAYSTSKGAILQMTRTLAEGVAGRGINVNVLCPGYVNTEILNSMDPERRAHLADRIPQGRIAEVEDMVGPAVFLASPASDFVNGTSLLVDGAQGAIH